MVILECTLHIAYCILNIKICSVETTKRKRDKTEFLHACNLIAWVQCIRVYGSKWYVIILKWCQPNCAVPCVCVFVWVTLIMKPLNVYFSKETMKKKKKYRKNECEANRTILKNIEWKLHKRLSWLNVGAMKICHSHSLPFFKYQVYECVHSIYSME